MVLAKKIFMALGIAIILASTVVALAGSDLLQEAKESFEPLPEKPLFKKENPGNPAKIELGKMLYFDTRLSRSNVFSCNSCHNLAGGGVDNNSLSTGHGWKVGGRNAPTVFNASLHATQFWDGRAADVEEQAQGPVLADVEMASSKDLILKRLGSIPEYVKLFSEAFSNDKEPLNYKNMAAAIGAFERTLLTPSRFDEFLKGNEDALSSDEKKGLSVFMDKGCVTCHNGVAVGGESFQTFGVVNDPPEDLTIDKGRFEITKDKDDMRAFKIPSLRNIELTYPYFHTGSVWDLKEAVRIMGWSQLGEKLTGEEVDAINDFLKSLTGERPNITLPRLPSSTLSTPMPDRD